MPTDIVVVRTPGRDPDLQVARVERIEFLNWNCKNTIICKRSEYRPNGRGDFYIERETPKEVIETLGELVTELHQFGWRSTRLGYNVYQHVLMKNFETHWAGIGLRRNGIDFKFYDNLSQRDPASEPQVFPNGSDKLVRHNFYASELDLLEFCKEFAVHAHLPFEELSKFYKAVGRKQPRPLGGGHGLSDISDALTDTERSAYRGGS